MSKELGGNATFLRFCCNDQNKLHLSVILYFFLKMNSLLLQSHVSQSVHARNLKGNTTRFWSRHLIGHVDGRIVKAVNCENDVASVCKCGVVMPYLKVNLNSCR